MVGVARVSRVAPSRMPTAATGPTPARRRYPTAWVMLETHASTRSGSSREPRRVTGAVVAEPERGEPREGERLGRLAVGQVDPTILVPDRWAEHDPSPGPPSDRAVEPAEQRAQFRAEPQGSGDIGPSAVMVAAAVPATVNGAVGRVMSAVLPPVVSGG